MGLSIDLLATSDAQNQKGIVARINEKLKVQNLPLHTEPDISLVKGVELPRVDWTYSTSDYLEFLAAKFIEDPRWVIPYERKSYNIVSAKSHQRILEANQSHIVSLPKVSGYYVPIYFESLSLHSLS